MPKEYPGDDDLGLAIETVATLTTELNMRVERLASSLQGKEAQFNYAQEYASWHAEELLQDMQTRCDQIAQRLEALAGYTRVACNRERS